MRVPADTTPVWPSVLFNPSSDFCSSSAQLLFLATCWNFAVTSSALSAASTDWRPKLTRYAAAAVAAPDTTVAMPFAALPIPLTAFEAKPEALLNPECNALPAFAAALRAPSGKAFQAAENFSLMLDVTAPAVELIFRTAAFTPGILPTICWAVEAKPEAIRSKAFLDLSDSAANCVSRSLSRPLAVLRLSVAALRLSAAAFCLICACSSLMAAACACVLSAPYFCVAAFSFS